ncbi:DUF7064 domain-containing protein [Nakamurella alba]|uniref:DUF7064 domain-containing protein n=1 Tax=Nakamurella alba TaxID=2665158 RepID=UPI0018AA2B4B|nr:hypothetical protein [Nakamurella alba]
MSRSYGDFTRPSYREPRWLETQWFSAVTTDTMIRLHFWMGFRTNLGVAVSKVYAYSGHCESVLDMELADMQYHSPIGSDRLSDFSLLSGVAVRGRAPQRYELTYRSKCGRMTARLTFEALMDPVTLDFSAIDGGGEGFTAFHRQAAAGPPGRSGDEPYGHIDQTMAVTGTVVLDGIEHAVDCVSNRDHSWSPRAEFRHGIGTFDLFHFGRELTLLTHTSENAAGEPVVSNGYVLTGAGPVPLRSAEVDYTRDGFRTSAVRYRVTDTNGVDYEITGTTRGSAVIDGGQNIFLVMDLLDCTWDGRSGWAEIQWHDDIMRLQGVRAAQRRAAAAEAGAGR